MGDLPKPLYDESGRPIRQGKIGSNLFFKVFFGFLFFIVLGLGVLFLFIGESDFFSDVFESVNVNYVWQNVFLFILLFMVTVVSFFKRRDMVASMGEKEVEGEGDEEFDEEGRLDDDLEVVDDDEEFEKDVEKFKRDNADLAEGFENQKR